MRACFSYFKRIIRKLCLKKKWRSLNEHNQTYLINDFDFNIVSVGKMSYGPLEVYGWKANNEGLVIGNYVSIAAGVKFILGGNHYYNTFSTYPFKVKLGLEEEEAYSNGSIIIEDDVWIGMDSIIMSGVTVGKGAVVAARSLVVKDVPPYSIVGGNPAVILKKRFDDSIINKLNNIDLYNFNLKLIQENIDLFYKTLDEEVLEEILGIYNESILEKC